VLSWTNLKLGGPPGGPTSPGDIPKPRFIRVGTSGPPGEMGPPFDGSGLSLLPPSCPGPPSSVFSMEACALPKSTFVLPRSPPSSDGARKKN